MKVFLASKLTQLNLYGSLTSFISFIPSLETIDIESSI